MNVRPSSGRRGGLGGAPGATLPWPLALAAVPIAASAAAWLLRPRSGLIAPEAVALEEIFSAEEVRLTRGFSRTQLLLGGAAGLVQATLLGALAVCPPRLMSSRGPARGRPLAAAAVAGAVLRVGSGLSALPWRAAARQRALRAGLATQSWSGWALDTARTTAIATSMSAALAAGTSALMRRQPRWWWVSAAVLASVLGAVTSFLGPVLLDPLFNRFVALAPGAAREDVLELAGRAGVEVGEVYEVDASRRTTAANAYVAGLGATKRVVLFDTLLSRFSREETRLVVAHELAHVRHRDVLGGLVYAGLVAPAALHGAAAVTRALAGDGEVRAGSPATLPAMAVGAGLAGALAGPPSAWLSRGVEARADAFSLRLTGAPESFESFERRVVLQNLADPAPPRWLVAVMSSHPPALRRIGYARAYARQRAARATPEGAAITALTGAAGVPLEAPARSDRTQAGS